MFIKAVKNDFTNKYNLKFEVGKEYKSDDGFSFTNESNLAMIADISGYGGNKLLETRFLEIEPIAPLYECVGGEYTSYHIKVIREIPISEIKRMPVSVNLYGYFHLNGNNDK
ncbi:hypothetical protein [Heyndrickxia sporothermodurans]|uniref:Uncharacterized protein n=1 Tax=Heyndrickxia sporothermodurans TaxID=46224 RepID=A0AB37HI70_9BACI|nr:hypothetical protein [Heyndrickxia sporothermodurans]MBL5769033.1 hypothetical protein [Heyndrickxia sporothermodurans]MBL5772728.1 hypothetical protein [Heyndrickxia sporothermodurans]MBL5783430.1 hypothetical protein [Heyndrickxia sporothermodurans]MBL5786906.1 hypothetical protein [Heyndrickxia sporothermodurans]MBL5790443.1 hypothetical protein [Heyndrickxia sporothermodurans]